MFLIFEEINSDESPFKEFVENDTSKNQENTKTYIVIGLLILSLSLLQSVSLPVFYFISTIKNNSTVIDFDVALENWFNTHNDEKPHPNWLREEGNHHRIIQSIRVSNKTTSLCPGGLKQFGSGDTGKFYCGNTAFGDDDCVIFR